MADTIASVIHVPHKRAIDEGRLAEWLSAAEYIVKLPDISSDLDSGDNTLAVIPDDVLLISIGFRCKTQFESDSHEPLFPHVTFGSSGNPALLGVLPAVYFQDTSMSGELPLWYVSTAGFTLTVDIGDLNASAGSMNAIAFGRGAMELWLKYRPRASKIGPMQGVRAR